MSEAQIKNKRQRSFLFVYESNSARDKPDMKVKNQKNRRNVQISDLDEEQTKKFGES